MSNQNELEKAVVELNGHTLIPHRHADVILQQIYKSEWESVINAINSLTEDKIKKYILKNGIGKSISDAINDLLDEEFKNTKWKDKKGEMKTWKPQAQIFKSLDDEGEEGNKKSQKKKTPWTIDFASDNISIEVAFNNAGSAAWNLIKPVLASEINHVKKEFSTKIGIVICASEDLRISGSFDDTIGTIETYKNRLIPMQNILSTPILLIGLKGLQGIYFEQKYNPESKKIEGHLRENTEKLSTGEIVRRCKELMKQAKKEQKEDKNKTKKQKRES